MLKKKLYKIVGMARDSSESSFPSETKEGAKAFDIRNMRITLGNSREDVNGEELAGEALSLRNEQGNQRLTLTQDDGTTVDNISGIPIGYAIIDDNLVLFTTQNLTSPEHPFGTATKNYTRYTFVLKSFIPTYISSSSLRVKIGITELGSPSVLTTNSIGCYLRCTVDLYTIIEQSAASTADTIYHPGSKIIATATLSNGTVTFTLGSSYPSTSPGFILEKLTITFVSSSSSKLIYTGYINQYYSTGYTTGTSLAETNIKLLQTPMHSNMVFPSYTTTDTDPDNLPTLAIINDETVYPEQRFAGIDIETIFGIDKPFGYTCAIIPDAGYYYGGTYYQLDTSTGVFSSSTLPAASTPNEIIGVALCTKKATVAYIESLSSVTINTVAVNPGETVYVATELGSTQVTVVVTYPVTTDFTEDIILSVGTNLATIVSAAYTSTTCTWVLEPKIKGRITFAICGHNLSPTYTIYSFTEGSFGTSRVSTLPAQTTLDQSFVSTAEPKYTSYKYRIDFQNPEETTFEVRLQPGLVLKNKSAGKEESYIQEWTPVPVTVQTASQTSTTSTTTTTIPAIPEYNATWIKLSLTAPKAPLTFQIDWSNLQVGSQAICTVGHWTYDKNGTVATFITETTFTIGVTAPEPEETTTEETTTTNTTT